MRRVSHVVAGNNVRDAVESRRTVLQHQTDLWRMSTGDFRGGNVPREPEERELLQHADYSGALTGGEWQEVTTMEVMQHSVNP